MGKAGFLTPKAIGNRIKAKGLLKLKFYCQVLHPAPATHGRGDVVPARWCMA